MNLKRKTLGILVVLSAILLVGCAQTKGTVGSPEKNYQAGLVTPKTLTIGLEGIFPPYSYQKNGKLTGFEVELGKDLAQKLNLKPVFVPTKWDSLIAGLGSGKFDVVLNNVSVTNQRKKVYAFGDPYIYSRYVLITNKNDSSLTNLSSIKGQKIAAGTGTNNQALAEKWGATVVPENDFVTAIDLIKQNRVVGTINSREAFLAYGKQNSTTTLKYTDLSKQAAPEPSAPLLNKKSTALVKKINVALAQLRNDGTLKKLSEKYFGTDITNK